MDSSDWYEVQNKTTLISPSLLVFPERIEKNIRQMMALVDDVRLLRPHIKTHKTAEIIKMQMAHGIQKFKCATIAEAELLAMCEAQDILLAMPLVGANINRFINLMERYPNAKFSTLVDNPRSMDELAAVARDKNLVISLWIDINNGMNRTGIVPDEEAVRLYRQIETNEGLEARGFHLYDGHIRNSEFTERKKRCDAAFRSVLELKHAIEQEGGKVETIIAGGSPTFPIHAERGTVETAPGTTLLWDAKYGKLFPDMSFQHAAVLFTRIISKPVENVICFDIGHKSIAPEMDFPRVHFLNLPDSEQIGQSEEHLVVRVKDNSKYEVGDEFYAIPMHICPTVAKYETLQVVENGMVIGEWKVAARNQKITI